MPPSPHTTAAPRHAVLLSAVSGAVLAHEILLMRILSFAYWHHLASMAVSMALLGFGAAGSFLFLARRKRFEDPDAALAGLTALAGLSLPASLFLFRAAGLDPFLLAWQPGEWLNLAGVYVSLSLPFGFAGGVVVIILRGAGERTPRIYAADLGGAGCGALAVIPALYLATPWTLTLPLAGLLLAAALPCARASGRPIRAVAVLAAAAAVLAGLSLGPSLAPRIHHTKGLPAALAFPDAQMEATRNGPQGLIHVVRSRAFHHVPGLSLQYAGLSAGELPEQMGLFVDGSGPGPITRYTGDGEETRHLDYTPAALAFHVRPPQRVLVVDAGGGAGVLLALHHGVPRIHALEANSQVADLMAGPLARFSGRILHRPGVKLFRVEARQYLHGDGPEYDLVMMGREGGAAGGAGGAQAAGEAYLWTTEAVVHMIRRLSPRGVLSITTSIQVPPRDSLRVMTTALEALRRMGMIRPETGILFIRSWNTATILVSRQAFSAGEAARARIFCDDRSFDLVHVDGMDPSQANRYDRLARPWYFEGARAVSGPRKEAFLREYIYDITPTTDDRPYFFRFFRWARSLELAEHLGREWLPQVESGYVFLVATLLQAGVAGAAFILMPLCVLRRRSGTWKREEAGETSALFRTLLYFACPGFGFMFFEMALLPQFTLLLAHPVYAASVVLSVVLVAAGLGSWSLERLRTAREARFLWIGAAFLGLWTAAAFVAGDRFMARVLAWDDGPRLAISVGCLALPAFLLGWPFPLGLRAVSRTRPFLIPWAWAVNGCASVTGAVLAKTLAMSLGFRAVLGLGWVLYVLAACLFPRPGKRPGI